MKLTQKKYDKWIAALRSGKYHQAQGTLLGKVTLYQEDKVVDGYCCLGVLAKVSGVKGADMRSKGYLKDLPAHLQIPLPKCTKPTGDDANHSGDDHFSHHEECFNLETQLAEMNDSGKTFPKIANFLSGKRIKKLLGVS